MTSPHDPSAPVADHPQRPRKAWLAFFVLLALLLVGGVMLFVGHRFGDRIVATGAEFWHDVTGSAETDAHDHGTGTFYTCGMHPWVILPAPGLCPICHMDLTPLDPAKFSGAIAIDPVLVQNIGVRTATVESGPLVRTVRTVGKVDYDETAIHDVNLKIAGWIDRLHVDFLGAEVKQGQALFELYSPELFAAQQEYLLALQHQQPPAIAFVPRVAADASSDLQAAKTRLSYFGIDDAQIAEIERTGKPRKTLTIASPYTGTVIKKMAVAGMRVDPGMQLYRIADLSKVWVIATVYEYQLPFVELGQEATMTLSYVPGQEFKGRVSYVYPWTDEKTREVNVRLEFDNGNGLFKPGMFASVELHRTLAADRTLVSRTAVLDTGERKVAFISLGNGHFEPRTVRLGADNDHGMVEVLDGLKPGEQVVISAQFLLDSESKIREALLRMLRSNLAGTREAAAEAASTLGVLPAELAQLLNRLLDDYLKIGDELASDSAATIAGPARGIAATVDELLQFTIPGHEQFWLQHDEVATIRGKALALVEAPDIAAVRLSFTDLSVALGKLLRATGVPQEHGREVQELHCPMFLENQGGSVWLQHDGDVRNPYFGSKMLSCFDRKKSLPNAAAPIAVVALPDTAALDALVATYLKASESLAADSTADLATAWQDLRQQAGQLAASAPAVVANLATKVQGAVPADGLDLAAARTAFAPLSLAVIELLHRTPPAMALERAWCPMVKAAWLQTGKELRNPYMGGEMLECGSIEETLAARAAGGNGR